MRLNPRSRKDLGYFFEHILPQHYLHIKELYCSQASLALINDAVEEYPLQLTSLCYEDPHALTVINYRSLSDRDSDSESEEPFEHRRPPALPTPDRAMFVKDLATFLQSHTQLVSLSVACEEPNEPNPTRAVVGNLFRAVGKLDQLSSLELEMSGVDFTRVPTGWDWSGCHALKCLSLWGLTLEYTTVVRLLTQVGCTLETLSLSRGLRYPPHKDPPLEESLHLPVLTKLYIYGHPRPLLLLLRNAPLEHVYHSGHAPTIVPTLTLLEHYLSPRTIISPQRVQLDRTLKLVSIGSHSTYAVKDWEDAHGIKCHTWTRR